MSGVNKVILIGNLGNDPESRTLPQGATVCEFRLATSERWSAKNGKPPGEKTEWHRVICWGSLAELCATYLAKGRQVYVEGRIQTRQWEDKEGNKRYTTEIIANQVQFLGSVADRSQVQSTQPEIPYDERPSTYDTPASKDPDDIPF